MITNICALNVSETNATTADLSTLFMRAHLYAVNCEINISYITRF